MEFPPALLTANSIPDHTGHRLKVSCMIASGLRQLGLSPRCTVGPLPYSVAADASAWDSDARSGMRLIAGKAPADGSGALRAGVELKLSPGWKTYWRYPGDSGVPPRFDFSRSTNVQVGDGGSGRRRIGSPTAYGYSIGYRDGCHISITGSAAECVAARHACGSICNMRSAKKFACRSMPRPSLSLRQRRIVTRCCACCCGSDGAHSLRRSAAARILQSYPSRATQPTSAASSWM